VGMYTIDGSNYMRIRDAAVIYGMLNGNVSIGWDGAKGTITIEHGIPGKPVGGDLADPSSMRAATATLSTARVSLNGQSIFVRAYTINGSTWFKLRDLATIIGFSVDYDGATNTIYIE